MGSIVARWRILVCLAVAVTPAAAAFGTLLSVRMIALLGSAGLVAIVLILGTWIAGSASALASDEIQHRMNQFDLRFERERTNLGGVAYGVAEVRRNVERERNNLGKVAMAVADVRDQLQAQHSQHDRSAQSIDELRERIAGEQHNLGSVAHAVGELRQELAVQRHNLGAVAGGLDHLRRSTSGFEGTADRHAAFEDALTAIAERVDRIGAAAAPGALGSAGP